ncbi:MAG: LPS assembly protein LptD [Alphaproteobacteria bacterium]|nr:LPS assembly protein LptD [Alphaproteobacteria bacterium]
MTRRSPDIARARRRLAVVAAAPLAIECAWAQGVAGDDRFDAPTSFNEPARFAAPQQGHRAAPALRADPVFEPPTVSFRGAASSSASAPGNPSAAPSYRLAALADQPAPEAAAPLSIGAEAPTPPAADPAAFDRLTPDASALAPERAPGLIDAQAADPAAAAAAASEETVLFEADTVTRDAEDGPIVAEGDVRAYFGNRFLRADRLIYDPAKDIVFAEGNVSITDENRETAFAGRVRLTGDLRDGVANNFSALMAENARVAADTAVREQGARTRFRKAVYTACSVCTEEGDGKTPTWRVKALKVVRDEERQVVRFHNAFLELKGVPILYSPFLQGPDPSVERQSGFLSPRIGADTRVGFNLEVPYYLAISNTQDATFFPKYTTKDGILWQAEYRRRDDSAYNVLSGGLIDFNNEEDDPRAPPIRWHVFAKGVREFGPNLRVGYDVERASDDLYLRRYNILRRGDLRKDLDTTQTNRLTSSAYVDYNGDRHSLRVDGLVFQDLTNRRAGFDSLSPYVLPRIDYEGRGWQVAGGETYVQANFTALNRNDGLDSRRLTAAVGWEREEVTRGGHRFRAFAEARGDVFVYDDIDGGTEATNGAPLAAFAPGVTSDVLTRFAPTVGVEWSYPLVRHGENFSVLIEPRVQAVASLSGLNDARIVNEDSRSIEFDFASLFQANKLNGFDAFEDGQRINIGVSTTATTTLGLEVSGELGQQFRLQQSQAFTPERVPGGAPSFPNGIGEERSDIVGSLNIRYKNIIGAQSRFRLDKDFGELTRIDALAYLNFWRFRSTTTYTRLDDSDNRVGLARREELTPSVVFRITDDLRANYSFRQNLVTDTLIQETVGLTYQDDCALFQVFYTRDRTRDRSLQSNDSFGFRFTLRTLVE